MSSARRSFHLALPAGDPRSQQIADWLDRQPPGADLSALLREVIAAGLERQKLGVRLDHQAVLLARIAADLAELRRAGVAAPARPPEPEPELGADDLVALGDLFSSFDGP